MDKAFTMICYQRISGDGTTVSVIDDVWSPAPPFKGMRSFWTADGNFVAIASRRHSVGYRTQTNRFMKTGGLVIEKGQAFSEVDEKSEMQMFVAKLSKEAQRDAARTVVDGGDLVGRMAVGLFGVRS